MRLTIAVASTGSAPATSATATAQAKSNTVTSRMSKPSVTVKVAKNAKNAEHASTQRTSRKAPRRPSSPQQIAQSQLSSYGWSGGQWSYLYQLWQRESGWSSTATNPGSGAYGIAQALPATQMNSAGSDWKTDATTQIKWGMHYIKDRYGSPQAAWAHEEANGWY
jgi:resuscitation-promoting factor RpfB